MLRVIVDCIVDKDFGFVFICIYIIWVWGLGFRDFRI